MSWDVIILGLGPAGSTAAQLLAKCGVRVLGIEKATFPRFHIGESLLPINLQLFERLGLNLEEHAIRKLGADFLDESSGEEKSYPFADGLRGTSPHAYQVDRARFDAELARLASDSGAELRFGVAAKAVELGADGVRVCTDSDELEARYVIDATGQDAMLGRQKRALAPIRGLGKVAEYTHFEDLSRSIAEELAVTGNVKVLAQEGGWAWVIPLSNRRLSLGAVTKHAGTGTGLVDRLIASSPEVQRITAGATRGTTSLARNFAYRNTESSGARFACIGDAGAFIDPVFSSGVAMAMVSAEQISKTLHQALVDGREADPDLMREDLAGLEIAYDCFGSMAKRFYSTRVMNNLFLAENPDPRMRAGLISILAGDVWRSDNPFQNALLSGRQRFRFADVVRDQAAE